MASVTYFVSSRTGALLRRSTTEGDGVFYDGAWHPTDTVLRYLTGMDSDVEEVTLADAKAAYPAGAF